jgi:hypothetical protein
MPYSDEQFANAVLMLVRQVEYVESNVKYPIEAIVENAGDCDVLSLIAASIMKAGGLDVVLLHYKGLSPSHVNIGVHLPYTPVYRAWWMAPTGYEYNNRTYWMAECTSQMEWKVGDSPEMLANAKPQIIPLENYEKSSPARVSSSLDTPLIPSAISITLSPQNSSVREKEQSITISGSISPAYAAKSIVIYVNKENGSSYDAFKTVTDHLGKYSLTWNFTSMGTYYIKASLSGFSNYASSDSEILTVFVGSYKPLIEDNVPEHYGGDETDYVFARTNADLINKIFSNQGGKEFLGHNLTGTGILLSGEFIVLRSDQTTTPKERTITMSRIVTVPIWRRRHGTRRIEQTITVTESEQTTNNQFGFILRHNGGYNYSASVRVLDEHDVFQITKQDENNRGVINASTSTKENTWYKIEARIFEDGITASLYDENVTLLKNAAARDNFTSINESGILITYDANTVIAFKSLKAEILGQSTQTAAGDNIPVNRLEVLAPYAGLAILLATGVATIAYVKKRSNREEKLLTDISKSYGSRHSQR